METALTTAEPNLLEIIFVGAHMYYIPALIFLGTLGNCLSVYVFFRTKMRRSSSSFYLAALAISDTGFLFSLLISWLSMIDVGVFNRPGYCQFFVYLPTLCSFLSVWFVVAFTVERFIAVRYPLRRQSMCTVARAKTILVALTILGLVVCSPVIWFSSPIPIEVLQNATVCTLLEEWETWASAFNVADTILTFVLPFTLIVVLNGMIVETVWSFARIRGIMTNSNRNSRDEEQCSSQQSPKTPVSQIKVTKMLLIVSSVFLCFNLPAYVMRVHAFLQTTEPTRDTVIIQYICNLLFDTNYGINFVLYCASGQNFRKAALRTIRCRRRCCNNAELRLSPRGNQSGSDTASSTTRRRTTVVEMVSEENYELQDLSQNGDTRRSKYPSHRSSRE